MRANPGGEIPPADVVGRDRLIEQLKDVLSKRSLVLSAERRIGKTCIIKKMKAECSEGTVACYWDLEHAHSPLEFAQAVYSRLKEYLPMGTRTNLGLRELGHKARGFSLVGVIKLPEREQDWRHLLSSTLSAIAQLPEQFWLFWDELPMMLDNLESDDAMAVLDLLRSLRQDYPGLRMIYTGSIGLHLVLRTLRKAGYRNEPTNDMETIEVPPLTLDGAAQELVDILLEGEGLQGSIENEMQSRLAEAVDGNPYFIHHVIEKLALARNDPTIENVEAVIQDGIQDPNDVWDLGHYYNRINDYYVGPEIVFALPILDVLALSDCELTFDDLVNAIKSKVHLGDEEAFRATLILLERDHYLSRDKQGYAFRFTLIRRWWRHYRNLD